MRLVLVVLALGLAATAAAPPAAAFNGCVVTTAVPATVCAGQSADVAEGRACVALAYSTEATSGGTATCADV